MELQNISIDFKSGVVCSYYDKVLHKAFKISNMDALKSELESSYGVTADAVVIQYTDDQHLDHPRIVVNGSSVLPVVDKLIVISYEREDLKTELDMCRTEIELELQTRLQ